ncbi:MAG: NupC/NupG family nucleoside CNT transporter [Alphaproteobacteria bacterium]|jgi:CNT family concentrative nucleoside transporter|nr:NupC/NupG family nucleoside CNT transporter [Alphaproteobacteria bacterium]
MRIIFGLVSILILLGIAYLLSNNRKAINLRTVLGAFFIQAFFAFLVLYVPFGKDMLAFVSSGITSAINAGAEGVAFVFGGLATGSAGFIFAINVLAIIIFFSALISVLYYIKVMPLIINTLGLGLQKLLKTSRTESLTATANIFVGQTEAPLVVKPFLNSMTKSEIFAVMSCGLASVAGGVLAGYALLGIEMKYLVAASFMAAPGGLLMAKIMYPQTESTKDTMEDIKDTFEEEKPTNVVEAAANGASAGLFLVANVGAMLIAFIGLVTLMDMILGGLGGLVGFDGLSFTLILGYVFSPFAFLLGIPWEEAVRVGNFLGQKIIFNEFVAYVSFAKEMATFSPMTQAITTFALCGFANISSIGILIGGLGGLSPKQRPVIAQLAVKAVIAGTLSNFMSAILAGIFLSF